MKEEGLGRAETSHDKCPPPKAGWGNSAGQKLADAAFSFPKTRFQTRSRRTDENLPSPGTDLLPASLGDLKRVSAVSRTGKGGGVKQITKLEVPTPSLTLDAAMKPMQCNKSNKASRPESTARGKEGKRSKIEDSEEEAEAPTPESAARGTPKADDDAARMLEAKLLQKCAR